MITLFEARAHAQGHECPGGARSWIRPLILPASSAKQGRAQSSDRGLALWLRRRQAECPCSLCRLGYDEASLDRLIGMAIANGALDDSWIAELIDLPMTYSHPSILIGMYFVCLATVQEP
jgi:hypothetical protein